MFKKAGSFLNLFVAVSMIVSLMALGLVASPAAAGQTLAPAPALSMGGNSDEAAPTGKTSHRLIVVLASPSLAEWSKDSGEARLPNGKLDLNAAAAQNYIGKLKAEQAAFIASMQQALPQAKVGNFINEFGQAETLAYQVVLNGLVIEPGMDKLAAAKRLSALPGVKYVTFDRAHDPDMYASLPLINAAALWNNAGIGGKANAGAGVKFASMDGGVHHLAPMFDGTGYSYPPGYPAGGLGLTANNNGKIIASRVYFRAWDPPSAGDENPWPGVKGTEHGTHTASTAAGNEVNITYAGISMTLSGVAPKAWVMSYRVFYNSVTDDGSFYDAEGIAALEDIAADNADVLNNSWGGGPGAAGEFDALDAALINVANSGVFVSMSAGNAGPLTGTSDHPSSEYIVVANSTHTGSIATGSLNVIAPTPISPTLQTIPFGDATYGEPLANNTQYTYTLKTALSVNPANVEGCSAWPSGTFTGTAALIRRGTCNFSVKTYYAQQAGAEFVVLYNNPGDNSVMNPGPGTYAELVTIPTVMIPNNKGNAINSWYAAHGAATQIVIDTSQGVQLGNRPDVIVSSSSRGPGANQELKPDIAAPGTNILAQGFAIRVEGEDRHLGFGQASGTSMASPHVAGAASLLRQLHPDWSNDYIKSALMTTSKYVGIYNYTGTHAQPLDMGAGRLDLTNAADPGVILQPVNASFGLAMKGQTLTRNLWVTNISSAAETFVVSTQRITATNFTTPTLSVLPGVTVAPANLSIPAGGTAVLTVTMDTTSLPVGDAQGFVLLDGPTHDAHFPVWGRVYGPIGKTVLVVDKDVDAIFGVDYRRYYTSTLTNLGLTFDVVTSIPSAAFLQKYAAVIYYTGDNYAAGASSSTATDANYLVEYSNAGGVIMAMGQDLSSVFTGNYFLTGVLGGGVLQDSVSDGDLPTLPVTKSPYAPPGLTGLNVSLSHPAPAVLTLTGAEEVPPVANQATGTAMFDYIDGLNRLAYSIQVKNPLTATLPLTITAGHIHTGTFGTNGPVLFPLLTTPKVITTTPLSLSGAVTLNAAQEAALKAGKLYVNFHSTTYPGGEIRSQIEMNFEGDGAGNQYYVDELNSFGGVTGNYFTPLAQYAGPYNLRDGIVARAFRDQPSLERPGLSSARRVVYTSFGLEGVNNGLAGYSSREALMSAFFQWAWDEPIVTISNTSVINAGGVSMFEAAFISNMPTDPVYYRWDFGDGTPFTPKDTPNYSSHQYQYCGFYPVRVEVTDSAGNVAIGETTVRVNNCSSGVWRFFLPSINK